MAAGRRRLGSWRGSSAARRPRPPSPRRSMLDSCALPDRRGNRTDRSERTDRTDGELYAAWLMCDDAAVVANAVISLIHQANYLLDRQIAGLERGFVQDGGYSEQLAAARIAERGRQNRSDRSDQTNPTDQGHGSAPACPVCSKPMVLRTARKGIHAGSQFWGCSGYPECKGTRAMEPPRGSD